MERLAAMSPDERLSEYVEGLVLEALKEAAALRTRRIQPTTLQRYLRRIAAKTISYDWLYDPEAYGEPDRTQEDMYRYVRAELVRSLRKAAGL